MQHLFRREALEARRDARLGRVVLRTSIEQKLGAAAIAMIVAALLVFLANASYTRRTRVVGQLVPVSGVAAVSAAASGWLRELTVAEGDRVSAGQLLGRVQPSAALMPGGDRALELRGGIERRRAELLAVRAAAESQRVSRHQGLRHQLALARAELAALQAQAAAQFAQAKIAADTLAKWQLLRTQGFVSQLQWQQQQEKALAADGEWQVLVRQQLSARRVVLGLEQSLAEWPAQAVVEQDALQRELLALERQLIEIDSARRYDLIAPVAGVVAATIVKVGESVQSGQPVLSLIPAQGKLQAELLVPSRAVGFLRAGDTVQLRYQAFPYQKFGHQRGTVLAVSRDALDPAQTRALLRGLAVSEPFYRVTVELAAQRLIAYGRAREIRAGSLLEADLLGDRRLLYEWLFEPWYGLRATRMDG